MPQRQARSYLEHTAIVAALKARDPDAAQRAMWQHLDDSMGDIAQRAQANPEMFASAA
jgi:DNA-binding GntR family transcriptional regulator